MIVTVRRTTDVSNDGNSSSGLRSGKPRPLECGFSVFLKFNVMSDNKYM